MPSADLAPGRWRCLLCSAQVWHAGTLQDFSAHYYTHHYGKEDDHGTAMGAH